MAIDQKIPISVKRIYKLYNSTSSLWVGSTMKLKLWNLLQIYPKNLLNENKQNIWKHPSGQTIDISMFFIFFFKKQNQSYVLSRVGHKYPDFYCYQ